MAFAPLPETKRSKFAGPTYWRIEEDKEIERRKKENK
jgi:hypothetical protein